MTQARPLWLALALASTTFAAHAQPSSLDAMKFDLSDKTKTIDCGGRDLTLTGDNDVLAIDHCSTITVVGNRNRIRVQLLPASAIAAVGNDNHIVFLHAPGFEARVTSSGRNNEIIPDMKRDETTPPH